MVSSHTVTLPSLFLIALTSAAACAGDPPVLEVGPVGFPAEDVRGLSGDQLRTLARLTAVGLAVSEDAVLQLGEPFVQRRREEALVQRLREHLALERAGIGDDVLRARYTANPEWELEVSHLVVLSERWRNQAHRAAARARAEDARQRLVAGEDFGRVAADVSEEPGAAEREGRLQPGREGTWVREFWEAASALDPGDFSEVTETEYGFHVLFLEDRRQVPFAEARDRVEAEMAAVVSQRAAWDAWVQEHTGGVENEAERRRILVEAARERGLQVPEAEEARIAREWERIVGGWIAVLGFEPGMSVTPIRERALEGLTRSGAEYTAVRGQVTLHGSALDDAYPVRFPDRPEDG